MRQAPDDAGEFLARLDAELDQPGRSMMAHPVVADILAGRLSREQVKRWVAQQYLFSRTVPKLLALRYAQVTDPDVLAHLRAVMDEELAGKQTGTDHHVKLHQRAARGLGMTADELERTRPTPETRAVIYWQELAIRSRPWFLALGMKYGDEGSSGRWRRGSPSGSASTTASGPRMWSSTRLTRKRTPSTAPSTGRSSGSMSPRQPCAPS
jgi:pyrroloquinoline quinone (PQQ) biosynthesis protein C